MNRLFMLSSLVRSAQVFQQQAIGITINDSDYLQTSIDRISARVNVT